MESRIIAALTAAFAPSELIVVDDSESHRGHSGFKEGGETHFNVKIRSSVFSGMSQVSAHRAGLHALSLDVGEA